MAENVAEGLAAVANELGQATQFKIAVSLLATIPPSFFVNSSRYLEAAIPSEDVPEEEKRTMMLLREVYRGCLEISSRYRKIMNAEEAKGRKHEKAKEAQKPAEVPGEEKKKE